MQKVPFAVGAFMLTRTDKFREFDGFSEKYKVSEDFFLSKKYELKILANNKVYLANWAIITNAKHYGGSFQLTKDTDIFEKKLITYLFVNLTRFDVIKNLLKILKKQNLEENNKVIKIVSDDIFVNSKLKVPIQCDGEFIGCLPVQIKNTKKTINLLVKEELNVQAD